MILETNVSIKIELKDIKEINKIRTKYLVQARDYAVDYELFKEIFDEFCDEIIKLIEVT